MPGPVPEKPDALTQAEIEQFRREFISLMIKTVGTAVVLDILNFIIAGQFVDLNKVYEESPGFSTAFAFAMLGFYFVISSTIIWGREIGDYNEKATKARERLKEEGKIN